MNESVRDVNSTRMKRPHFPNVAIFEGYTGCGVAEISGVYQH